MFQRVLLAVDGSDDSQKAVDWAIGAYRQMPDTRFTVLHVCLPYVIPAGEGGVFYTYEQAETNDPKETVAYQTWSRFPDRERVNYLTVTGNPANEICEVAKDGAFDLIVLGSSGHGAVASVLLGSVSAKVLHRAPCSVLVVR
ncbi:universal stress protein [Effusibacillus pohliae]|uniref:universal stress protein n=1 Tax=Effusibacillus pohliae TaxID=232270 RepID=UPI00037B4040|nr:universal stress protein [Effusibacillus pohliae]